MNETVPPATAPTPSPEELEQRLHQGPNVRPDMTQEELERLLGMQVVDVTQGVHAHSVDAAEEHINHETSGKLTPVGFVKRVWKGNLARDYIRQRRIQKGRQEIVNKEDLYALHGGTGAEHEEATGAIVDRFQNEWLQDGEENHRLGTSGPGSELARELREAVSVFSRSSGDAEALRNLDEARKVALRKYGDVARAEDRNRGLLFASDIMKVAQHARAAVAIGIGSERVEAALHVKLGDAKVGAQTEARFNAVDKVVDKLYGTRLGSMVNETTLAVGAGVVMSALKVTTSKVATAAGAFVGMGVGAGVVAGVREHFHIAQDRSTHMREMAEGGQINTAHGKRREKLEATRYQTKSATELLTELEAASVSDPSDVAGLQRLVDAVSETQLRLTKSAADKIDLIQYSSKSELEGERRDLFVGMAQAKAVLRRALQSADAHVRTDAGIASQDINEVITGRAAAIEQLIKGDMGDRDSAFRKLQMKSTLKMGAYGAVSSMVMGLGIQEVRAELMSTVRGVFEQSTAGANRETLLAGIFRGQGASGAGGAEHLVHVNGRTAVKLPNGYHLKELNLGHGHGHEWQLTDPQDHVLDKNVTFDKNGQFSEATRHLLEEKGYHLGHHLSPHEVKGYETRVKRTPGEYFKAHHHEFTPIDRELWYDNDTPNIYDHNELDLWWGGHNGTGIDANGNYVFNVAHMTNDGSWHGGLSAHAHELMREGKLRAGIVIPGHEGHAYELPVDKDGNIVINKHSFFGRSLFSTHDGHAEYANKDLVEIYQNMGTHHGINDVRVLSTYEGTGPAAHAAEDIIHHGPHSIERMVNTLTPPEHRLPIEIPFVMPLYGRKGLEDLEATPEGLRRRHRPETGPALLPMYYGGRTLEEMREWIKRDPARLRTRREVVGPDGQVHWVEADGSPVVRDVSRERSTVRSYLEGQRINDPEYFQSVGQVANAMDPMDDACRVAINVPAWMEAKNLRQFLEQFTDQMDDDGARLSENMYEINVLVNRKTGTPDDNSIVVVQDFIRDFQTAHGFKPKVNFYNIELDPPNNNVGYARKLLTDVVMLRSLRRTGQTESLYIESEDADINRADPKMVFNLMRKLDRDPHLDAVRGVQDRDPDYLVQNDMLFLRRRIWDFAETLSRAKKFRDPTRPNWNYTWNRNWLSGWNTGYSAEAYALAGGYDNTTVGEDMVLGERMSMVRGDGTNPNLEVIGRIKTRANGSPRRFIMEIKEGEDAYAPGKFEDEDLNQRLRNMTNEQLLDEIKEYERISPENASSFGALIGAYISAYVPTVTSGPTEADQMGRRLMFWLGFQPEDYDISDGNLTIKSFDSVKSALERYRQRHAARRGRGALPAMV